MLRIPNNEVDFGRLVLALQEAACFCFDESDWKTLAYETGSGNYIINHPRLLRSLSWSDPDYKGHVLDVISFLLRRNERNLSLILGKQCIREWLKKNQPDVYEQYVDDPMFISAPSPALKSKKEVFEKALFDAETLAVNSGPENSIDRIHTAIHAYLKGLCNDAHLQTPEDAGITKLLKIIRDEHPAFSKNDLWSSEIRKILLGFSSVIDAINVLRNHASMAHPNETLLSKEDAYLAINATRTIISYIDSKVKQVNF